MVPLVILAGGRGTRLGALALDRPKFLAPVAQGRCFADVQLAWIADQGFREVVLAVGHHAAAIRAHVGDGRRYALTVRYSEDGPVPLGTGGALRRALLDPPPLAAVLYGDTILDIDCRAVVAAARDAHALMTVIAAPASEVPNAHLRPDGTVVYDKRHPNVAFMDMDYGLSVVSGAFVAACPAGPYDLADAFAAAARAGALSGFRATSPFHQINTPGALRAFQQRFGS